MRGPLLMAGLLMALAFSGCLADLEDDGKPNNSGGSTDMATHHPDGTPIMEGDDLGSLTFSETGNAGVAVVDTECDLDNSGASVGVVNNDANHEWVIPNTNANGAGWKVDRLELTLSQDTRTALDLDFSLLSPNGQVLARAEEVGPDGLNGPGTIVMEDLLPGTYRIEVHNCSGVALSYNLDGSADMIATATTTLSQAGDVTVRATGNTGDRAFEATRVDNFAATFDSATGTADLSTGAGYIDITGTSSSSYSLKATLTAYGSTEAEARERLAEMYVEHQADDTGAALLEAHGRPGGNDNWNRKEIDLDFVIPMVDWTTFAARTAAGSVDATDVTATAGSFRTAAGSIDLTSLDIDRLTADTSAGSIDISDVTAGDVDASASAGSIDANMNAAVTDGTWSFSSSAGAVDVTVVENSNTGYDVDARTSAGSVTFDFSDVEETSSNCQYASCHREGQTNGYASRTHQIVLDLDTSAGSINAGS